MRGQEEPGGAKRSHEEPGEPGGFIFLDHTRNCNMTDSALNFDSACRQPDKSL